MNDLNTQLQQLRLSHTGQVLEEHLQRAIQQNLSYADFLKNLLDEEIAHRKTKRIQNRMRQAQLPGIKSIDQFDFSFPAKIPKQQVLSLLSCKFIEEHQNVIFLGAPGVGKTHSGYRRIKINRAYNDALLIRYRKRESGDGGTLVGDTVFKVRRNLFRFNSRYRLSR